MQICAQASCAKAKSNMYIFICADANMCTGVMCRDKKQYVYIRADANLCTGIMCGGKKQYVYIYIYVQMQICAQAFCAEAKSIMFLLVSREIQE